MRTLLVRRHNGAATTNASAAAPEPPDASVPRLCSRASTIQTPMMNADKAPSFDEMVRECKGVTLGEAKQYAAALPAEKRRTACGCYTCSAPACPACCFPTCLVNFCGGCLMYNPFMCACPDSGTPGAWTCTDMKGITKPHPNPTPNM